MYTKEMELWHHDYCMGIENPKEGTKVLFYKCGSKNTLQKWEHSMVSPRAGCSNQGWIVTLLDAISLSLPKQFFNWSDPN